MGGKYKLHEKITNEGWLERVCKFLCSIKARRNKLGMKNTSGGGGGDENSDTVLEVIVVVVEVVVVGDPDGGGVEWRWLWSW